MWLFLLVPGDSHKFACVHSQQSSSSSDCSGGSNRMCFLLCVHWNRHHLVFRLNTVHLNYPLSHCTFKYNRQSYFVVSRFFFFFFSFLLYGLYFLAHFFYYRLTVYIVSLDPSNARTRNYPSVFVLFICEHIFVCVSRLKILLDVVFVLIVIHDF